MASGSLEAEGNLSAQNIYDDLSKEDLFSRCQLAFSRHGYQALSEASFRPSLLLLPNRIITPALTAIRDHQLHFMVEVLEEDLEIVAVSDSRGKTKREVIDDMIKGRIKTPKKWGNLFNPKEGPDGFEGAFELDYSRQKKVISNIMKMFISSLNHSEEQMAIALFSDQRFKLLLKEREINIPRLAFSTHNAWHEGLSSFIRDIDAREWQAREGSLSEWKQPPTIGLCSALASRCVVEYNHFNGRLECVRAYDEEFIIKRTLGYFAPKGGQTERICRPDQMKDGGINMRYIESFSQAKLAPGILGQLKSRKKSTPRDPPGYILRERAEKRGIVYQEPASLSTEKWGANTVLTLHWDLWANLRPESPKPAPPPAVESVSVYEESIEDVDSNDASTRPNTPRDVENNESIPPLTPASRSEESEVQERDSDLSYDESGSESDPGEEFVDIGDTKVLRSISNHARFRGIMLAQGTNGYCLQPPKEDLEDNGEWTMSFDSDLPEEAGGSNKYQEPITIDVFLSKGGNYDFSQNRVNESMKESWVVQGGTVDYNAQTENIFGFAVISKFSENLGYHNHYEIQLLNDSRAWTESDRIRAITDLMEFMEKRNVRASAEPHMNWLQDLVQYRGWVALTLGKFNRQYRIVMGLEAHEVTACNVLPDRAVDLFPPATSPPPVKKRREQKKGAVKKGPTNAEILLAGLKVTEPEKNPGKEKDPAGDVEMQSPPPQQNQTAPDEETQEIELEDYPPLSSTQAVPMGEGAPMETSQQRLIKVEEPMETYQQVRKKMENSRPGPSTSSAPVTREQGNSERAQPPLRPMSSTLSLTITNTKTGTRTKATSCQQVQEEGQAGDAVGQEESREEPGVQETPADDNTVRRTTGNLITRTAGDLMTMPWKPIYVNRVQPGVFMTQDPTGVYMWPDQLYIMCCKRCKFIAMTCKCPDLCTLEENWSTCKDYGDAVIIPEVGVVTAAKDDAEVAAQAKRKGRSDRQRKRRRKAAAAKRRAKAAAAEQTAPAGLVTATYYRGPGNKVLEENVATGRVRVMK